jgi:hypothetical protein
MDRLGDHHVPATDVETAGAALRDKRLDVHGNALGEQADAMTVRQRLMESGEGFSRRRFVFERYG